MPLNRRDAIFDGGDFGCGSKSEILAASRCFPLFYQHQTFVTASRRRNGASYAGRHDARPMSSAAMSSAPSATDQAEEILDAIGDIPASGSRSSGRDVPMFIIRSRSL